MPTPAGHTTAIRASRVIGTPVYNTAGDHIGEIEDVVLDKTDNRIMFGVVGFGGFLGMGEKYHPLPWASLNYEKEKGGYIVPYSKDELKAAPCDTLRELTQNDGLSYHDAAYDYYKAERYW